MARIQHPNLVQVLDIGTTSDRRPYFAMERLAGEDLRTLLQREHRVAWRKACFVLRQVCLGLGEAHACGIVHRDLKPENVFLLSPASDTPSVRVLDFGIAKRTKQKASRRLTLDGVAVGSPIYMAPEQAARGKVDHRTDIYAAGIILHEALVGVPPHYHEDPSVILEQRLSGGGLDLRGANPDVTVPRALEAIIGRALKRHPRDRFQSMQELADALAADLPT